MMYFFLAFETSIHEQPSSFYVTSGIEKGLANETSLVIADEYESHKEFYENTLKRTKLTKVG